MGDPHDIALEHYLYWRSLGLSHDAMLQQLGIRPSWRGQLSSDETIAALAEAYVALLQTRAA